MKTSVLAGSAFAEGLTKFGNGLIDFFTGFTVAYAAEIVLVYLLVYYVSRVLRENDATRLMFLYWGLLIVMGVMQFATSLLKGDFYLYFVILLSMFMLILFNVEVKKSLWDVHNPRTEKADDAEQGTLSESSESAISNWRRWRPMRENMKWRKSSKEDINLFQAIWELLQ